LKARIRPRLRLPRQLRRFQHQLPLPLPWPCASCAAGAFPHRPHHHPSQRLQPACLNRCFPAKEIRCLRLPVITVSLVAIGSVIGSRSLPLLLITATLAPIATLATAIIVLGVAISFSLLLVRTLCRCILTIGIRVVATIAALLSLLLLLLLLLVEGLRGCHDPEIVLGMLEVVFSVHNLAGRNRITRQLQVFVGHRLGVATHLHVRAVALVNPVQGVGLPPAATAAATAATTAATASGPVLVMLSLSHAVSSPGLLNYSFEIKSAAIALASHLRLLHRFRDAKHESGCQLPAIISPDNAVNDNDLRRIDFTDPVRLADYREF
jgi:hypothetical protein